MKRILALDVGTARVGVAVSDPLGMTAQPLEVIHRKKTNPVTRIIELIAQYEPTCVVVGQPLQLDGAEGQAAQAVAAFVASLRQAEDWPGTAIEMWDERMTTAEAQRVMIDGGTRRDRRKKEIDKVAAALILQSYLDSQGAS